MATTATRDISARVRLALDQDTFVRANTTASTTITSGFGAASSGSAWSSAGIGTMTYQISGNEGVVTASGGTAYQLLGTHTLADAEALVRFQVSSLSNTAGIVFRFTDLNNHYRVRYLSSALGIVIDNAGTTTTLATTSITTTINTLYWIRARIIGNTLYGKMWKDSTTEPTAFQIQTTDSTFTSANKVGLVTKPNTSSDTIKYDSFVFYDASATLRDIATRIRAQGQALRDTATRIQIQGQALRDTATRVRTQDQPARDLSARVRAQSQGQRDLSTRIQAQGQSLRDLPIRLRAQSQGQRDLTTRTRTQGQALRDLAIRIKAQGQSLQDLPMRTRVQGLPLRDLATRTRTQGQRQRDIITRILVQGLSQHDLATRLLVQGRFLRDLALRASIQGQSSHDIGARARAQGQPVRDLALSLYVQGLGPRDLTTRILIGAAISPAPSIAVPTILLFPLPAVSGFAGGGATVPLLLPSSPPILRVNGVPLLESATTLTAPQVAGMSIPAGSTFSFLFSQPSSATLAALATGREVTLTFPLVTGLLVTGLVQITSSLSGTTFLVNCTLVAPLSLLSSA